MSDISERLLVHCPDCEASRHLAAFIDAHTVHGGRVRIALHLPLRLFTRRLGMIERQVIATLYPIRSIDDPHPTYSVTWAAAGGGPFPEFSGALAVEKSVLDDAFGLIVTGHYDPPLGFVGTAFDRVFGHRIARAVAGDLLATIAHFAEGAATRSAAASRPATTGRGSPSR